MSKLRKNKRQFIITDDIGNIDNLILREEILLLLPHAENLLTPLLKKKLTKQNKSSKVDIKTTVFKEKEIKI